MGLFRSLLAAVLFASATMAPLSIAQAAPDRVSGVAGICQLDPNQNQIRHVIYVQFDNTHLTRDRANIASDLEQMPHLLSFMQDNGTVLSNDHTILISHTAGGILSALTGLYPDRQGQTVSNSYGYFNPASSTGSTFSSSFKYWTDLVDDRNVAPVDSNFNMISDGQKNTPAPWVPFTRAGCDFGGVSTANLVLENTSTGPAGDMTRVFGNGSAEWNEASAAATSSDPQVKAQPQADFVGIAIHCAAGGGICAQNAESARPDVLPDEPGGYNGFEGLFGAKYVDPAITGQPASVPVNDLEGSPIVDPQGNPGFPGFDAMLASVSLGYVAQMQEAGVPVTYAYISDAHDNHTLGRASGPGEDDYQAQLQAYDSAFDKFFHRLASDGIDQTNTLFVFTADEGDHFAGGNSSNGTWSHTFCNASVSNPTCPDNQIGEVNANISALLPSDANRPKFDIHADAGPTFYVKGQPDRSDPVLRKLERDVAAAQATDPYVSSSPAPIMQAMADPVGEQLLHMVNADPKRTPSFTLFARPDYFVKTVNTDCPSAATSVPVCIDYHFAWSHGDTNPEIATTWLGLVGPGVEHQGRNDSVWTDHSDIRPTILALLGLVDDYRHDGRALTEVLATNAQPQTLIAHRETLLRLATAYKQINAPFGDFCQTSLVVSTAAVKGGSSTDDSQYASLEGSLTGLGARRDQLALNMIQQLEAATFDGAPLDEQAASAALDQANSLLADVHALASRL